MEREEAAWSDVLGVKDVKRDVHIYILLLLLITMPHHQGGRGVIRYHAKKGGIVEEKQNYKINKKKKLPIYPLKLEAWLQTYLHSKGFI